MPLARFKRFFRTLSFARVVCLGFFAAIFLGSFGLYISEAGELSYVDSLYLSASSICVTGLSPIPLSGLNASTHWIMLFLIQLGGLGIISFTVIVGFLITKGISRNARFNAFVGAAIDTQTETESLATNEVNRILLSIINISFSIEILGAIGLYLHMPEGVEGENTRWFFSLFTSISSFNNAGFSITDDLSALRLDPFSLYIVSGLVIFGGIGFPVIILLEKVLLTIFVRIVYRIEVVAETLMMEKALKTGNVPRFLLLPAQFSAILENRIEEYNKHLRGETTRIQSKLLVYGSFALLLFGFLGIYFLERSNPHTFHGMELVDKISNAFFMSVCSRTAGFSTMDLGHLNDATVIIITVLMFIGGGPQGTAGGIKITTFVLLLAYLKNVIQPSKPVMLFGEIVSKNSVAVAIRVYFLATVALAFVFILLGILDQNQHSLHVIFFELISSFSTVGYSLNLTSQLGDIEKIFYAAVMYVGRVGIFTVLIAATGHSGVPKMGTVDDGVKIQVG
ncbi:TrkH family potassium uptake protein [Leptospira bouyouniensis]|uniref:TrkH family potassium uptake protein n=1 Tax=Leptospira bouyouniensis TaxID=2484911 RepID=UPI0010916400|nr:potassium transporter TrkG [Leptospira bouyouniensis]TGM80162.1 potassium transporter Trk [Leptospira bouyouniensis]